MAKTYTVDFTMRAKAVETTTGDLGNAQWDHLVEQKTAWAAGTAVNQVAMAWSQTIALGVGNVSHDLTANLQLDAADATIETKTFAVVKGIWIDNSASTSGKLTVGGGSTGAGAADAFAGAGYPFVGDDDLVDINFGGSWQWTDPTGVAVSNGATDDLHFVATTATQTFNILIVGE